MKVILSKPAFKFERGTTISVNKTRGRQTEASWQITQRGQESKNEPTRLFEAADLRLTVLLQGKDLTGTGTLPNVGEFTFKFEMDSALDTPPQLAAKTTWQGDLEGHLSIIKGPRFWAGEIIGKAKLTVDGQNILGIEEADLTLNFIEDTRPPERRSDEQGIAYNMDDSPAWEAASNKARID